MGLENDVGGEVEGGEEPDEDELARFRSEVYEALGEMTPRQLAYHFKTGTESQRMIYRSFLEKQQEDYRTEFDEAIADPLLGEREEDNFAR